MTSPLTLFDEDSSTATDTSEVDNAAIELAAHWNGPQCEKCEAPMKSDAVSVCRRCGWYARLNQFVDVDQDWEIYGDEAGPRAEVAKASHAAVWLHLLPPWAWIVIVTVSAVVAESVVVRLVTPDGSAFRTTWSLTQLVVGLMAFASCHLVTFLFAIADDADTGVLDIVLRPLKLWFKLFAKLPARLWLTDTAAAGLTAAVMSVVVIGGLPYERLWDWGFKQPPKHNLMGAVMSQVQKVEGKGADNLEDAVKDFAGTQNLDAGRKPVASPPSNPRQHADCVILGYRLDTEGRLQSLVLGTAYRKKLVYACSVSPQLSADESAGMLKMLSDTSAKRPYLPLQISATWVVPKYSCRVSYGKQENQSGRLLDPQWEEFLGKLR
jgi:hypothetical protein